MLVPYPNSQFLTREGLQGDGKPISEAEISAAKTQQGSSGGIPVIVASSSASEARAAAGAGADGGYVQLQGLSRDAAEQVNFAFGCGSAGAGAGRGGGVLCAAAEQVNFAIE